LHSQPPQSDAQPEPVDEAAAAAATTTVSVSVSGESPAEPAASLRELTLVKEAGENGFGLTLGPASSTPVSTPTAATTETGLIVEEDRGALVLAVAAMGAAGRAGVQANDVILTVNGTDVQQMLYEELLLHFAGRAKITLGLGKPVGFHTSVGVVSPLSSSAHHHFLRRHLPSRCRRLR
jgi:predicted metalloprotease with PDZ domain